MIRNSFIQVVCEWLICYEMYELDTLVHLIKC